MLKKLVERSVRHGSVADLGLENDAEVFVDLEGFAFEWEVHAVLDGEQSVQVEDGLVFVRVVVALAQDDLEHGVFDPLVDVVSDVLVRLQSLERPGQTPLLGVQRQQPVFRQLLREVVLAFPLDLRDIFIDQVFQTRVDAVEQHVTVVAGPAQVFQVALEQDEGVPG